MMRKGTRLDIRMKAEQKDKINELAKMNHMSVSAYVTETAISQCQSHSMKEKNIIRSLIPLQAQIKKLETIIGDNEAAQKNLRELTKEVNQIWHTLSSQKKVKKYTQK